MLDVMLHLAFITYVNLREKIDENRWVLSDARCDKCFPSLVGTAHIKYCEDDLVCFLTLI